MGDVGTSSGVDLVNIVVVDEGSPLNAREREGSIGGVGIELLEKPCSPCDGDDGPSERAQSAVEVAVLGIGEREKTCNGVVEGSKIYLESNGEMPRKVIEDDQCDFMGLSPLRTMGTDGGGNSSGIDNSGLLDETRDYDECAYSVPLSSVLASDCSFGDVKRDATKEADESCHMSEANTDSKTKLREERFENLKPEKVEDRYFGSESVSGSVSECMGQYEGKVGADAHLLERINTSLTGICEKAECEVQASSSLQGSVCKVASPCFEGSDERSILMIHSSEASVAATDIQGSDVAAVDERNLTCGSNIADCCGKEVKRASAHQKPGTLIVFRRCNPKRAASMKSSQNNMEPDRLIKTKINAKKCKEAAQANASLFTTMLKPLSDCKTKKRSCSHKSTRLSVWGAAENLLELFKKNDEIVPSDSVPFHIWNENSKRGRSKLGTKRQNKGKRDRRSQASKKKNPASSDPGYTMGKNCLQTTIPAAAHSQTLLDNCSYGLPDADFHADSGLSKETSEVECKILGDWFNTNLNSSQQKSLHGDKDLESIVTQDALFENLQGDCVGISSRIGSEAMAEGIECTHSTDPGTSPDSDVFHPTPDAGIINNDGASSVSGSSLIDGNSLLKRPNQDSLHAVVMASSETLATPESTSLPDTQLYSDPVEEKKGKTEANGHPPQDSQCFSPEEKFHSSRKLKKARKPSKSSGRGWKKQGAYGRRNSLNSKSIRKSSISDSTGKSSSVEPNTLEVPELVCHEEAPKVEIGQERSTFSGQELENAYSDARRTGALSSIANAKGHKISRGTKAGFRDGSSTHPNSARHRKQNTSRKQKETSQKSKTISKHVVQSQKHKTSNRGMPSSETADILALTGLTKISNKTDPGSINITGDVSNTSGAFLGAENSSKTSHHAMENKQALPSQAAWVLCDDCQKWRCISAELADIIDETKCRWTCKDNMDKAFADCAVPQEKTDAQINAELGISDEEERLNAQSISKGVEPSNFAASSRPSWNLIKSNIFLHRNRRTQSIDEIMVCHCKPPSDGRLGCGDLCLNRMLNIECVRGTCPCGDLCSNQQFQKRKYSKFECFPCGKKGYGLKVVEDVRKGQFLIEYVGEVLDLAAYEARQRYYASRGQKHFYFMTLNGGEVIDACAKGNLGRFINHSCDPNCRTEKWMVNGEVCIGLFAIRDIKQGEEVTFDYNYVRVFGAAAKKCVCGSSECQGYIGGDPSNAEVIVQCDSDEEYPVPVMVHEDSDESMPDVVGVKVVKHIDGSSMSFPAIPEMGIHQQTEAIPNRSAPDLKPLHNSQNSGPMQSEIIMSRPASDVIQPGDTTQGLSVIQTEETICKPIVASSKLDKDVRENKLDIPEPYPCSKSSHAKVSLKKGRLQMEGLMPQKFKQVPHNGFYEGVEEKLNELLDADGGISKRKDATKGYLKLLFVTAAEGDNVRGCASQSIRDLSLILDALLKTRSRVVLTDIISKNGLQMLHNIMKQNRNNFNRIPIIRKLLKVLEFLASKGILTPEHMNKGPPCNGMESFRESIFSLTKHNDNQVLQSARDFRDKWIPRSIKSVELSDRDYNMSNAEHAYCNWTEPASFRRRHHGGARDSDAIICVSEGVDLHPSSQETCSPESMSQLTLGQPASSTAPLIDCISMTRIQRRKRKSRWDQPADITNLDQLSVPPNEDFTMEAGSKFMRSTSHEKLRSPIDAKEQHSEANLLKEMNSLPEHPINESLMETNLEDEAPPGFESSCKYNHPQVPSKASEATVEVVTGQLQERYLSHLTVSYGIPLDLLQQFGTYKSEGSWCPPCWAVAPGMPFHPFPPLPPYPRANACTVAPADGDVTHGGSEGAQLAKPSSSSSCVRIISSNTSGERLAGGVEAGVRYWQTAERGRWHSSSSGRRFFRPHKWNNEKFQRRWQPWPRERNGQRMRGGRSSDGVCCTDAGNTSHVGGGGDFQKVVSSNGFSSSFHQNDNRTDDVL